MIKTRFSPSPTGLLHLGNARTALFSTLYAKHAHGTFLLRIEDTDLARSDHKYTESLQEDLHWLDILWQEGPGINGPHQPYWQSQRHDIYKHYYQQLEESGSAYSCFCTDHELMLNRKIQLSRGQAPRYAGTCRKLHQEEIAARIAEGKKPALRFHVPDGQSIDFIDLVKGQQHFSSDDIGDFIIRRAEGTASFMFCNAIDDSLMEITHVLRGEDHLANTPRQLLILQTLGLRAPQYGHLSLITGEDGSQLSKRHGSVSVDDFRQQGYLPQAMLNYLARLGHTYDSLRLMSFHELAENFNPEKLIRSSARFDSHQLSHWQKEAVMALDIDAVWRWLGKDIKNLVPLASQDLFAEIMRQNIHLPHEATEWANLLFGSNLEFDLQEEIILKTAGEEFFTEALRATKQHGTNIKNILDELKHKLNVSGKNLFMPIRTALTSKQNGPELAQIAALLGPKKMQKNFEAALKTVKDKEEPQSNEQTISL